MEQKRKIEESDDENIIPPKMIEFNNFSMEPIEFLELFKNTPRLLKKLKDDIEHDNFYEIHQLYKTIHFRGMNNNLVNDCIELIFNAILYFASKENLHCCFDLSKVFIDTLKRANITTLEKDLRRKIKYIHAALRNSSEERNEFTATILKWSSSTLFPSTPINNDTAKNLSRDQTEMITCQKKFGHVDIHLDFALNLWSENNYDLSRYHFLHSCGGRQFAHMSIECHLNHGYPSEYDLFLVKSVIQYIFLRNLRTASEFYQTFIKCHPYSNREPKSSSETSSSDYPLINFTNFIIQAIKKEKADAYKILIKLYKPSLDRDPSLYDYLDRIGLIYFNIKSKNTTEKGSMFSNLFKALVAPDPLKQINNMVDDMDTGNVSDNDENDENVYDNNLLD